MSINAVKAVEVGIGVQGAFRKGSDVHDMITKEPFLAQHERSDTCTVPAAGVIGETMVALVLARAFLEKFGGDSIEETSRNYAGYLEQLRSY